MTQPGPRLGCGALLLGLALVTGSGRAAAQDTLRPPPTPPPPATPAPPGPDTTARDTLAPADTARVWTATFPAATVPGPLPWGSRHIFDADSLRLSGARTLADLLVRVPGVFVARGGYYGQAEPAFAMGRGGAAIEVYWDGMPWIPLGRDSVFLDLARVPLAPLERVEILRAPDRIRIDLVSVRSNDTDPRSTILVLTGDQNVANYRAMFLQRWRSGFGLSLAGDYNALNGDGRATTEFRSTDLWLKFEYVPSGTAGASLQLMRTGWEREASANLVDAWEMSRRDLLLRAFVGARADGLGWRLSGMVASSLGAGDTAVADRDVTQGGVELARRWPRGSMVLAGHFSDGPTPQRFEWQSSWLVLPWLDVAVNARRSSYTEDRTGTRLAASAGLRLPLGFSARAEGVRGEVVSAPRFAQDSVQQTTDWLAALRWDMRWATIEVARRERDAFQANGFPAGLRPLALLGPTPPTTVLEVHGTLRPLPGLELSGWYADAVRGGGDFEPPHHARYAATFFSRFWRVYRSGVFALRAEVALESWSSGLGGIAQDSLGNTSQVVLPGATFLDMHLEIQIVGVTLFWQMRNARAMRGGYVRGLPHPGPVQFYGARWTFRN